MLHAAGLDIESMRTPGNLRGMRDTASPCGVQDSGGICRVLTTCCSTQTVCRVGRRPWAEPSPACALPPRKWQVIECLSTIWSSFMFYQADVIESPSQLAKHNSCGPGVPDGHGAEQNTSSFAGSDGLSCWYSSRRLQRRYGEVFRKVTRKAKTVANGSV